MREYSEHSILVDLVDGYAPTDFARDLAVELDCMDLFWDRDEEAEARARLIDGVVSVRTGTRKRLYFGHPVNTYGTRLEDRLLQKISEVFPGWEIENPNQECHQRGYEHRRETTGNGMDYFTELVLPSCIGGVFLPFRDGAWGAGVFREAKFYADRECPVWMIDPDGAVEYADISNVQPLTVEETRSRIRTASGETVQW